MAIQSHSQIVNFIWSICNLLRGPYKRNEYRKVILPLTVLRRFDCILDPAKDTVLNEIQSLKGKSENIINAKLREIAGVPFYNLSKLNFKKLLDDPNHIAPNLNSYINSFSANIRQIFERFDFGIQVNKLNEKNLLFNVIKKFASDQMDLSPSNIDNLQMGYVFEELIRIGAEQANEEAGEHFTPREVIKLMVNLLLSPEEELRKSHVVKTIYDPACGTGGMLSVAEQYIRDLNSDAQPHLYGQDWNDEAYAICRADMLIKGEDADNIKPDCTFEKDGFKKHRFDYMLANPPFGVEWKTQQKTIENERISLGYEGRFGAGTPRINDGSLLFLQHMISKMRTPEEGGSRIGIVFNGSPLFTGDAGSGESNIRQWIIENDWLEAVVALPDQLFYNTGISTYIWIISNRKEQRRKGKIQLIDARNYFVKMRKSLGNKRHQIGDGRDNLPNQIAAISEIYGNFRHNEKRTFIIDGQTKELEVSKIFDNIDFGFNKITVERPLRLNFQASEERINRLDDLKGFINIAASKKKNEIVRQQEIEAGQNRQQAIKTLVFDLGKATSEQLFKNRAAFLTELKKIEHASGLHLSGPELKVILEALSEKDETAEVCRDTRGRPEPDSDLRDTENVPLKENVEDYFKREVLPHVPDAWIDYKKTKVGYEIPLNRHFYRYEPPRELEEIETDIKELEREIVSMLGEITGSIGVLK
ncbi:class I SAM-dependent DNA methyltransferase [Marispirochaeta sp.]|uniref:type I restriction-modification system subunit M n=1 Tax=Marispirochaeta sp. TaxID=2038653 RepID=UPI0029C926AC|nr:class I SAM-dependent DNA methyltransferase [Marispirochaeta sp.]